MPTPNIWAIADTRISSLDGRESAVPLLNEASKLFSLPITCVKPGRDGFFSERYFSHSVGFAYAGGSLIALNLYSALLPLLSNLASLEETPPRLDEVALFVSELLRQFTISRNQYLGDKSCSEIAIFGYCHMTSRFRVFHLSPDLSGGSFHIVCSEVDASEEDYVLLLGDKKPEILADIQARRSGVELRSIQWWRTPKITISGVVENGAYPTIGGSVQMGIADERGYFPFIVCSPIAAGSPPTTMRYLGFEVWDTFDRVGQCHINMPGMA